MYTPRLRKEKKYFSNIPLFLLTIIIRILVRICILHLCLYILKIAGPRQLFFFVYTIISHCVQISFLPNITNMEENNLHIISHIKLFCDEHELSILEHKSSVLSMVSIFLFICLSSACLFIYGNELILMKLIIDI